jgi:N-acetylglucosaminyldiphosphoundecaprenol N-acetyl-beta-D-mannosaminyltransferase
MALPCAAAQAAGGKTRERVDILGCTVDRVSIASAAAKLAELIRRGGTHQAIVLPVHSLMYARRDQRFLEICNNASIVLPDGVPLLWASRVLRASIPGRVAGSDLFWELSRLSEKEQYTCFLLGGKPDVLARLEKVVRRRFPALRIAGSFSPTVSPVFSPAENDDIIRRVNAARPDILWVGLGAPRQEKWIHANLGRLQVRLAIGVGAAFDMCSGTVRRAPMWAQRAGLEWFYRFLREPKRLFRRYFIDSAPFLPLVLWQFVRDSVREHSRLR